MNDEQLLRYSRQIMLPQIDAEGQQRLSDARVLIVGLGGLGSAASIYLCAAGVGHLTLADFDKVDLSNLQRQIVHGTADIGRKKTDSAADRLRALNPDVRLQLIDRVLEGEELREAVSRADVVVDGSDNFRTRFAINEACVRTGTPLVSGAAIRFEAQVSVFDARDPDSPCYRCLYGEDAAEDLSCAANGVMAPLLGIVGSIQAAEAMKLIMEVGRPLKGRLVLFDALAMEWHSAVLNRDPDCPVCGNDGRARTDRPARSAQAADA
jgi:adenylyltransferase/sulfurtransferase